MTNLSESLLAALRRPAAYPHAATDIEHLETHISHVFLAGDHAYKLKKPVDFGFLDFTTLDRRRMACQEEVRLNRRLAPDIYLGVVSVCQGPHGMHVAPEGCPPGETEVEQAVHMRRFSQDSLLDRLAQRGALPPEWMDDIARQLVAFHAAAEHGPAVERYADLASLRAPAIQNFEQTAPYVGRILDARRHQALRAATEDFLDRHATQFAERVAAHRIVDGHGDLHLRNMCRVDGRVVIFDCIEFNPALRAGDVLNDIAFLTMDLDHRGLAQHGNRFLNEYLEQCGDYAGLPLLDYYQAYRACVRAKVSCFESDARPGARDEATAYFSLAENYYRPRQGGLLITSGVSGSGKSTAAREAAQALQGIRTRSDAVRKHLAGIPLTQRGTAALYTPAMTVRTYTALLEQARAIVQSGRWAILDAVHARRDERHAANALARELGVPFGILHCEAPRAELVRRLEQRRAGSLDVSDADVAVLDRQLDFFEPLDAGEGPVCTCSGGTLPVGWRDRLAGH